MKSKVNIMLGIVLSVLITTAAEAQTVLNSTFATVRQFEAYTVVDQNADNQTWQYDDLFLAATCSRDYDADDWLITPALRLNAAKTYRLTFSLNNEQEGTEQLAVAIGTQATADAMTTTLLPTFGVSNTVPAERTVVFTVGQTGTYYVGFHFMTADSYLSNRLYLNSVVVEETMNQNVPAAVADLTATPAADGSLTATVTFRTPELNVGGGALAELSAVTIVRDGKATVKTFQAPATGTLLTYTDEGLAAGSHTYRVVAANSYGQGEPAEATVYVGQDVPGAVTNLRFVYDNDTHRAHLSWDAPTVGANGGYIDPSQLTYSVRRLRSKTPLASGLAATEYDDEVDTDFLLEAEEATRREYEEMGYNVDVHYVIDGEGLMQYYVRANSPVGQGKAETVSNYQIIGQPQTLPYTESFAGGELSHYWRTDIRTTLARWSVTGDNRYTQDGDGGMLGFNAVANETSVAMAHTGNIDMAEAVSPVLTFYYYTGYAMKEPLLVKVSRDGGDFETLTAIALDDDTQTGRYIRASVPLTDCAGCRRVQVGFEVTSVTSVDLVYLDNISIIDQCENDLGIVVSQLPRNLKAGETRYLTAEVRNLGTTDVATGQYTVNVYVNGQPAGTAMGLAIASGAVQTVLVPVTATIAMLPDSDAPAFDFEGTLCAEVDFAADQATDNNRTPDLLLTVKMPRYPVATGLTATATEADGVAISWSAPAEPRTQDGQVTDGFELYTDFQTSNFGDWTLYDMDHQLTWTPGESYSYANAGLPQAYMVWNNEQVFNQATGRYGLNNALWQPRTGERCLASFGVSLDNCDDWLVSPELSGNAQIVSFYAHGTADSQQSYTEQFQLYVSTTGIETTNFFALDQQPRYTTTEWQRYDYALPQGAKYFALRKVTPADNSYALLIDDVTFAPDTLAAQTGLMLYGYNIYKNGTRVNTALVAQPVFTDPDGQPGDIYQVTAVYNAGESIYSRRAVADGAQGIMAIGTDDDDASAPAYDLGGRPMSLQRTGTLVITGGRKTVR